MIAARHGVDAGHGTATCHEIAAGHGIAECHRSAARHRNAERYGVAACHAIDFGQEIDKVAASRRPWDAQRPQDRRGIAASQQIAATALVMEHVCEVSS